MLLLLIISLRREDNVDSRGRSLVLQLFQPWLEMIGVLSSFKVTVFKVNSTAVSFPALHPDLKANALKLLQSLPQYKF